jgi:hypothetical protein
MDLENDLERVNADLQDEAKKNNTLTSQNAMLIE